MKDRNSVRNKKVSIKKTTTIEKGICLKLKIVETTTTSQNEGL
jgi:hypothetical protein